MTALADLVVIVHFAYVLVVIAGLLLILLGGGLGWTWVRNRWFRGIHLAMIGIVVLEAWLGITCPLTEWEQDLRAAGGQETYQGDFIARWVHDVLFLQGPPWVFTLAYTLFGLLVVLALYWIPPRWRSDAIDASNS